MPQDNDVRSADEDEARWEERLKKVAGRNQPGPAKKVGDDSPNPLPDDTADSDGGGGGDPGRV